MLYIYTAIFVRPKFGLIYQFIFYAARINIRNNFFLKKRFFSAQFHFSMFFNVIFFKCFFNFIIAAEQLNQWYTNIKDTFNRASNSRTTVTAPRSKWLLEKASFLAGHVVRIELRISKAPGKEGINVVSIFAWPNYKLCLVCKKK